MTLTYDKTNVRWNRRIFEYPLMKANPGGQLDPSDIVGREELIDRLWRVLRRQSLVLVAVRRMGKTCIVKKDGGGAPRSLPGRLS